MPYEPLKPVVSGRTRRSFLGGVAAAGAAHTFAGPLVTASATANEKPCTPAPPGIRTAAIAVTPDRRTVWTADTGATTITAHRIRDLVRRRSIDVGGTPLGIAISSDGDLALVTTAYAHEGLAIVDLRTGQVDHVDVGPDPYAVAFAPNGRSAYVSGGGREGTLTRVDPRSGRVHAPVAVGEHPRGVALHPDGKRALVALNGDAAIAVLSLARGRVLRRIATRPFPYLLAIAPDGRRALASHNGFGDRIVTPIDLVGRHARRPVTVGTDPAGVAFSDSGALALVAATGSRTVTLLDGRTWRRRRTVRPAGVPRSVAIAAGRAIVADGGTGRLTAIRLGVGR
jgi:DNA-binding beta-propeller fold protein YncE